MLDRTPKVFISYSWTSDEYRELIIEIASRMRHDGVDVKLDAWDLKDGDDKYVFMEQCVINPDIDKVLIFSDKRYAAKADARAGGVGDETAIISAEMYGKAKQNKFIPILMERDEDGNECLPAYLKSRKYRDLSGENFEEEYRELIRTIFDAPLHRKPEIGCKPIWLTEDESDDLFQIKEAGEKITAAHISNQRHAAIQDFMCVYIESLKQFYSVRINNDIYLNSFVSMKEYRNTFLDQIKAVSSSSDFGNTIADQFEILYNAVYDLKTFDDNAISYNEDSFELFRVHVWELFVCTVAYMLHYEMYSDIHDLLVHTYYLRTSPAGDCIKEASYEKIKCDSKMLEKNIKPTLDGDLARKYTLLGYYVCNEREYKPIYSGKSIANADLFLYQVYNGLNIDNLTEWWGWFPTLYVYADGNSLIWRKLKSKRYCEKIKDVFGVESIAELKERISKCTHDDNYRYSGAWNGVATAILDIIDINEIGTLP